MKSAGNQARRRMATWVVVLLLVGTHLGAYLLARSFVSGGDAAGAVDGGVEPARSMSGKSSDREADDAGKALASLGPAGFRRLLAELEQPGSGLSRGDFVIVRAELFREWLRRDLMSAMDVLYRPENEGRYGLARGEVYGVLGEEIARHPDEVAEWIGQRRYGSATADVAWWWARTLLDRGQVAAVLGNLNQLPKSMLGPILRSLAPHADAAQLVQMRAAMDAMGAEDHKEEVLDAYATRKVRLGKDDLAALFAGEEDPQVREELAFFWATGEAAALGPRESVAALMKLPEDLREGAAALLVDLDYRGGYAARAELLDALDAQGLVGDLSDGQGGTMIRSALDEGVRPEWDKGTPAKLLELAQTIQRDDLRHYFLRLTMWGDPAFGNVNDLLDGLPSLPAGGDRDALVAGMAGLSYLGPELRGKLLEWVGDERLREEVRTEMSGEDGIPRGPVPDF